METIRLQISLTTIEQREVPLIVIHTLHAPPPPIRPFPSSTELYQRLQHQYRPTARSLLALLRLRLLHIRPRTTPTKTLRRLQHYSKSSLPVHHLSLKRRYHPLLSLLLHHLLQHLLVASNIILWERAEQAKWMTTYHKWSDGKALAAVFSGYTHPLSMCSCPSFGRSFSPFTFCSPLALSQTNSFIILLPSLPILWSHLTLCVSSSVTFLLSASADKTHVLLVPKYRASSNS